MGKYIDKERVVKEIKKRINEMNLDNIEDWRYRPQRDHDIEVMKNILSIINTLEVKDVDLKNEIVNLYESNYEDYLTYEEFAYIANYFFELGLKVQKGEQK